MALKPCRECKKKISTETISCPNCGVPNPAATLEKQNNSKLEDTNNNYKKINLNFIKNKPAKLKKYFKIVNLNFIKNKPAKLKKYFKIGIVVLAIYSAVPSLWFLANIISQPKYGFKYFVSHFIPTAISREDVVTWRDNQEYYKIASYYTFVPFYSNLFKSKNFVAQKLFYIHKKNNKKEYEFFGYRDLKNDKIVYQGAQIYYYDYSTEKIVYIKGEYNSWRGYRCLEDDCGVVDFQKSKPLNRIREASIDEVESLISYYKNISDKFINSIDYNTIIKIVDSKGNYVDKNIIVKNNYEDNKVIAKEKERENLSILEAEKFSKMSADDRRDYTCTKKFGFRKGSQQFNDCRFRLFTAEMELEKLQIQKELAQAKLDAAKASEEAARATAQLARSTQERQEALANAQIQASQMQSAAAAAQAYAIQQQSAIDLINNGLNMMSPRSSSTMNLRTNCTYHARMLSCF